ncbi:DUF397 domain-containing protein [Streptomyces clavuligerus]|uniref:DUF397 domain-containing protein n=1 Tax=Streptomyces clavuligerus TaxID=1901 RepID=B5GTF7_STRCL|nr:DUF397 domain-containing protein [Streptomyces clavuligerus]ANW19429.1 DUF397 domain-containing protein [Streptomyces clavuligerus]AXU14036.1 DUF397 domain-containing protein [Streptomyces clavuligerus]EDY49551.1 hypothetical protein SSCG_02579 [Streptomyces clavuligerus]EFG07777.1 DUF397 domain-containing protein [Streptomyces clavuligerus]MBY6304016.1 DUF397 domain-containing protein [Streptomyces clavuligerus]
MTADQSHSPTLWIKSSYSGSSGGQCVEWSPAYASAHGTVPVRDSKTPTGPALAFSTSAWTAFVGDLSR